MVPVESALIILLGISCANPQKVDEMEAINMIRFFFNQADLFFLGLFLRIFFPDKLFTDLFLYSILKKFGPVAGRVLFICLELIQTQRLIVRIEFSCGYEFMIELSCTIEGIYF